MEPQTVPTDPKKTIFKNPAIYIFVLIVLIILAGVYLLLQSFPKETKTQGSGYVEGQAKDKATVGVIGSTGGLYPNISYEVDSLSLNYNFFEGLTGLRNGRVQPLLAESWTNPDDLTWMIKIRKNVKFHSGQTLKASDVVYSIDQAKTNKDWVSNFIAVRVDSAKVIDENTVELKTATPDPTLLHWMVSLLILSEDQVKTAGVEKAVGTGPYQLVSSDEEQATLAENPNYWGQKPKVKSLVYKSFKDRVALAEGLKTQQIDVALITDKSNNEALKSKGYRILPSEIGDIVFIEFDTLSKKAKYVDTDKNPFADIKVRKAILLGLDVADLLKKTNLEGGILSQFSTKDLLGFNLELTRPATNIKEAKELLSQAGFPNGFKVTLDLDQSSNYVGQEIKSQLALIGITVSLNPIEDIGEFLDKIGSGDSSFYLLTWLPDTLDSTDLLNFFAHTYDQETGKGSGNFLGYSNKSVDEMLDKASTTFATKERTELVSKTHKAIMEDLPLIPLYTRVGLFVVRDDIAFKPAPFGYIFGFELSGRQKAQPATK